MYRIALADDDRDLLMAFEAFFSNHSDIECVFTVDSLEGLYPLFKHAKHLDYLFLDMSFPRGTALEAILKLRKMRPETEIIIYTVHDDEDFLFQALSSGATGYLLKSLPLREIRSYIEISAKGGAMISPFIARKIIQYFNPASFERRASSQDDLSATDRQLLKLLADGKSYKMAASVLGISEDSVRYHIKKLYRYLHVNSKAEAIKKFNEGNY